MKFLHEEWYIIFSGEVPVLNFQYSAAKHSGYFNSAKTEKWNISFRMTCNQNWKKNENTFTRGKLEENLYIPFYLCS